MSNDSTLLHELPVTLCMGHTHDHIHFELNKVLYKISISYNFFRLLPFSALLLMANQGGKKTAENCSCCVWDKHYSKTWALYTINLVATVEDNAFFSLGH